MTKLVFYAALMMMTFSVKLQHVSVRASQVPVPKAALKHINNQLKTIIIKETVTSLKNTSGELQGLVKVCEVKLNKTVESCKKCSREFCARNSVSYVVQKTENLQIIVVQLLFLPLTIQVVTIKVLEENLKDICDLLGNGAKDFLNEFGNVAKDVSNTLLKGADSIIKQSVKGLVQFGENLANFAEDIGKGLTKSFDDLTKGAVHVSQQVLDGIKDIGSEVQKAAERTIKEATKTISHISNQVGKIASDAGKAVAHVANEAGKAVHHVVRSVGRFVGRIFRGWGKRSTREKRLLKDCQKVCPSCLQIDSPSATQTLTIVCGAEHTKKQDKLIKNIKLNQRLLNITLAATNNIVNMVTFDPTMYNITTSGVVYLDPIVTLNITGTISKFLSNEPFNPMVVTPFAKEIIDEISEKLVI